MAERLVAADANPLIGLAAVGNARLAHSIRPLLERLRVSGFRLSDELIRAILMMVGEG